MKRILVAAAVASLLLPLNLSGQSFGVAPRISTTGVGADVALSVHPKVNVRAGVGFIPVEPEGTFSEIDYTITFPSPQFTGVLDFYPTGGGFRLSGGVLASSGEIEVDGAFSGTVTIGDQQYSGAEVAELNGLIETKGTAPYAGVGWGNHAASGIGLAVDLGVGLQGDPEVTLSASGQATESQEFQQNLREEEAQAEEDLGTFYKVYPVLSIGLKFGIGGR